MSDWWESTGIALPPGYTGGVPAGGLVDPAQRKLGETAPPPTPGQLGLPEATRTSGGGAPQAGQWSANNQGFLDWATKTYGADANSFVKLPQGQGFQDVLKRYTQETGNQATYQGGASGDKVDFGQGTRDALTSSGQIWRDERNDGGGGSGGGGGLPQAWTESGGPRTGPSGGPGGTGYPSTMPAAPAWTPLGQPAPFESSAGPIGRFSGPMAAAAPGQVGYQNAQAPGQQSAQQLGRPQSLNYQTSATPTAFSGSRQAAPGTLSYENMATPAGYAHQDYKGPTAEEMAADPSYKFRLEQGQNALENSAASKGMLRTGNTAKGLIDYGQGAASQEYAAIDARSRATNAANNAGQLGAYQTNAQTGLAYGQDRNSNAFQFGQANLSNAERANADNYGRASTEAQQGFQNQNAVEQQNNAGRMNAAAGNNAATLARTQANNQANLAYGGQNFSQGFAVNQANNQGNAQAISTNNAANQAAQAQAYGQAANTFGQNTAAQAQQYGQQLGAYQTNTGNAFQVGQANNANALAQYQAQTNAALGYGNLGLGYQNSNNAFTLGQGSLGVQQGQLGLGYGQLGLQTQGQQFNQGLATYDRNYAATVTDPWNQGRDVANAGRPTYAS